jgi:hypothetical protein
VIVDNFHLVRVGSFPPETDSQLIVDADAVLAFTGSFQFFQSVPWGNPQIREIDRGIDHQKLAQQGRSYRIRKSPDTVTIENLLCVSVCEAPDHR